MLTLKAGTKKYLLIDDKRVARNSERAKKGEPIIMVAEVVDNVITLHRADTIQITAAVHLEYSQNKPLDFGRGYTAHAVYVTEGEVVLDADEAIEAPAVVAPEASAGGKKGKSKPAAPATETPE